MQNHNVGIKKEKKGQSLPAESKYFSDCQRGIFFLR